MILVNNRGVAEAMALYIITRYFDNGGSILSTVERMLCN